MRQHLVEWLAHWHPASRQRPHFDKLHRLLSGVVDDPAFRDAVADLQRVQADFGRLRRVLRVLPAGGAGALGHDDAFATLAEAQACERQADAFRRHLRRRLQPTSTAADLDERSAEIIVAHLDPSWSSLFGHAFVTDDGGLLLVDRTNNAQERGHRFSKRCRGLPGMRCIWEASSGTGLAKRRAPPHNRRVVVWFPRRLLHRRSRW